MKKRVYNKEFEKFRKQSEKVSNILSNKIEILKNLDKTKQDWQVEQVISSLILYTDGNAFFAPKLWDNLSEIEREKLIDDHVALSSSKMTLNQFYRISINFFNEKYSGESLGY